MSNKKLKVLELFSGKECMSNAFRRKGHQCFTVDWDKQFPSNLHMDVEELTTDIILEKFGKPDIIFAGTDCTTYSVAAVSKHRRVDENGIPQAITEYGKKCDRMNRHVRDLANELGCELIIENPRGMMRKMDFVQDLVRNETTYCFGKETKIITKNGTKQIGDICGKEVELLSTDGQWIKSQINNYGKQKLYKLILSRARKKKEIYVTGDHLWISDGMEIKTTDLVKGQHLDYVKTKQKKYSLVNNWVARGFTYGDGWILKSENRCFCQFVDEKQEMIPYFDGIGGKRWDDSTDKNTIIKLCSLPLEFKNSMPSLNENPNSIYSWLAGYMAADGSVNGINGQVSISTSKKEDVDYIRDLFRVVGIDTYAANEYYRKGYGEVETPLYQITVMKSDIDEVFFLRKKHKNDFIKSGIPKHQPRRFTVVAVEETDRYEDVYCADVPHTHCFALEDGILTHNCQYGFPYMKPTDFFATFNLHLKQPCKNGSPCHERAPRGSRTGLQGIDGKVLRSIYQDKLCEHIVEECEKHFKK